MLPITPQCPQRPHRERPGPDFSSVRGGPRPKPEEPRLGSQTTLRPQPDGAGPLMLRPALRLRCHSSVRTATLPSRTHPAPKNSGHGTPHVAFPRRGASPRMRQKTGFVFFAPKIVPLRVFLSQTGYLKTFQAFTPSSLSLSPQIQNPPANCADLAVEGHLESNHMGWPVPHCLAAVPVPSPLRLHSTWQRQESL